jgi:hypothetical protein
VTKILHLHIPLRGIAVILKKSLCHSRKAVRFNGYEDWKFGEDGLVAESLGHFDADEYERQLREGVA